MHFNGARAAREAGYSEKRDSQTAYDLLQDEDISALIEERLDELAMSAAEATKRVADIARADIGDYFYLDVNNELRLDREAVLNDGGGLIKEISWDKNGNPKLKLYSAEKALRMILDAHGAFEHAKDVNVRGLGEWLSEADIFDDDE